MLVNLWSCGSAIAKAETSRVPVTGVGLDNHIATPPINAPSSTGPKVNDSRRSAGPPLGAVAGKGLPGGDRRHATQCGRLPDKTRRRRRLGHRARRDERLARVRVDYRVLRRRQHRRHHLVREHVHLGRRPAAQLVGSFLRRGGAAHEFLDRCQPFPVGARSKHAQVSAAASSLPQVLITLASRFQRLSWKYRSIAYATTLKNVGVLYQTMYLVATSMRLASCALGGGNSALFAEAIGTDYCTESSVGEFTLGSMRDS